MATITEQLPVSGITLIDQNGAETPTTSATVLVQTTAVVSTQYGIPSAQFAKISYNLDDSQYAATKQIRSAVMKIRATTVNIQGYAYSESVPDPDGYYLLPEGTTYDAADNGWSGANLGFQTYIENGYAGKTFPLDIERDLSRLSSSSGAIWVEEYINLIAGSTYGRRNAPLICKALLTISGMTGTVAPYIEIEWVDATPVVGPISPSTGAYVNDLAPATFTANIAYAERIAPGGHYPDAALTFKWREVTDPGTVYSINCGVVSFWKYSTTASVSIPANTFPSATAIEWCLSAQTDAGETSTDIWKRFTTVESAPSAPVNLAPSSSVVDGTVDNIFRWQYVGEGEQGQADLEYSANGISYNSLATVSGSDTFTTIPANTLPNGNIFWRVKTYSSDLLPGSYSEAVQIAVKAKPNDPIIESITTSPRPTVTWSGDGQVSYRVRFEGNDGVVYDSGELWGGISSFRCPLFLPDGFATITVYTGNSSGLWASSSLSITVTNSELAAISLTATEDDGVVRLTWGEPSAMNAFYVLRNGIPIAKVSGGTYVDKSSAGTVSYIVRGTDGENYSDSNVISFTILPKVAAFYDVDADSDLIPLFIRKSQPVVITKVRHADVSLSFYSGRSDPVATDSGFRENTFSLSVTYRMEDANTLNSALGHLCCVKDKSGDMIYGVLTDISQNIERWADVTLNFTKAEGGGIVSYD